MAEPKNYHISQSLAEAHNPSTSVARLEALAQSTDPEVRAEVATHQNATPEILTQLADDPHYVVLAALATNPRLAPELLDHIADRVAHGPHAGAEDEWSHRRNLREAVEFAIDQHRQGTDPAKVAEALGDTLEPEQVAQTLYDHMDLTPMQSVLATAKGMGLPPVRAAQIQLSLWPEPTASAELSR